MARALRKSRGRGDAVLRVAAALCLLAAGWAVAEPPPVYTLEFDRIGQIGGSANWAPYALVYFADAQALPGAVEPGTYSAVSPLLLEKPLEIQAPNGGESFLQYQTIDVRWRIQPESAGDLINLDLYRNGEYLYPLAYAVSSSPDPVAHVPLGSASIGGGYAVRATSALNGQIYDESDIPFAIEPDPNIYNAVAPVDWMLYP